MVERVMRHASPQSIGRTLARLGRSGAAPGAGGGPPAREAIFDALARAGTPRTIEQISQATGLHANTVRTHLDVLHAAGRVERRRDTPRGPGRPAFAFAVAPDAQDMRHRLAAELLGQLHESEAPALMHAAAARWAAAACGDDECPPHATPDDAVRGAVVVLGDLGFDAHLDAVGDRIELRSCPYADLVGERPVICDIHAALLVEVLDASRQPVRLHRLDVWARPGLCVAHLERPDLEPDRVVYPAPAAAAPDPPDPTARSTST